MKLSSLSVLVMLALSTSLAADRCSIPRNSAIYSNAYIHAETGDLLGYELSISPDGDTVEIYVYQGDFSDPVSLPATYDKGRLKVSAVDKYHMKLNARVTKSKLVGTIAFGDEKPQQIELRRVSHVWGCKRST